MIELLTAGFVIFVAIVALFAAFALGFAVAVRILRSFGISLD